MSLRGLRILEKFLDAHHIRQIEAFTKWRVQHGFEQEGLLISFPGQERTIGKGNLAFILCAPGGLLPALQRNNRRDPSAWQAIFSSTELEIWEYRKRYEWQVLPLRFGLSEKEKAQALAYAREALETYLKTGELSSEAPGDMSPRFQEQANADVTLWVEGAIRGSYIIQNFPFITAVRKAAVRACRDERFKPLSAEELDAARIEIAVLSDLQLPLSQREISANTIDSPKGYVLSVENKIGWYLPTVLNCLTFTDLKDFLTHLIEDKASSSRDKLSFADIRIFEVENFIESVPKGTVESLRGPVVKRIVDPDQAFKTALKLAERGADFLCRMQEADGNIPPIIDPLTGKMAQIDWTRLAFAAWALALFGTATKKPLYLSAARKALVYLFENLPKHPYVKNETRCYAYVYGYHAAALLGEVAFSGQLHEAIGNLTKNITYNPILYCQIALQRLAHKPDEVEQREHAWHCTAAVLEDFENRLRTGARLELAEFPELIPLLRTMGHMKNSSNFIEKSENLSAWYAAQQLPTGAFPSTIGSQFCHVRGSGKIFEVLCLEPDKNLECIERAVCWLSEMQYTEDNTHFIKPIIRGEILGSFRHDYRNQAAWIDAVAHVLVGAARLVDKVDLQK